VRPLYDLVNSKLIQFGIFHETLSIDESMTPYCGRHSCKVYLHNKPIRFGYKHFSICSADVYPYKTIPYPDKSFDKNKPQHLEAVTKLLDVVDDETRIDLYFD